MSIKLKIILLNSVFFGLILLTLSIVIYENAYHNAILRMDSELSRYASAIQRAFTSNILTDRYIDTVDINEVHAEGPAGVTYLIYSTTTAEKFGTFPKNINKELPDGFSDLKTIDKEYRCLKTELESPPGMEFFLIATAPLVSLKAGMRQLLLIIILMFPVCLLLAGDISRMILNFAFRDLTKITHTAQKISESNLETQLKLPDAKDEIWMLCNVFNEMLARLNTSFKLQKQFIADASHEIKTPLAIIHSELEYAMRSELPYVARECIGISLSETDRLAALTSSLLMLVNIDSGQTIMNLQPVKIDELLSDTVKLMKSVAGKKNIKIKLKCSESISINADSEKLTRVILNIIDNAIKYSPDNSTVQILQNIVPKDQYPLQIIISDNGQGIGPLDMSSIFNRFYRSESLRGDSQGSGLGLSIAYDIVKLHNGILSVQSELNKGSDFIIKLPLS